MPSSSQGFNEEITEGLLKGARQALADASVREDDITVMRVPGAFEIPVTAPSRAETGQFDAVICIGCVIKGETMHFEYIAGTVCQAMRTPPQPPASLLHWGADDVDRGAGGRAGRGWSGEQRARGRLAAVEMATLFRQLHEGRRE